MEHAMDSPFIHDLVERKMALSSSAESEQSDGAPPAVPIKTKSDPDAPPSYQPAPSDGRPLNGPSSVTFLSRNQIEAASSAYNSLQPHPSRHPHTDRGPLPLHTPPSPNDISIPFYSNPAPRAPATAPPHDRKEPILADVRRPSKEADRSPAFACLTLHSSDKLGSTNLPAEVTNDLDRVIRSKWAKGVQKWAYEDGGWCWQLSGKPCKCTVVRQDAVRYSDGEMGC